MSSLHEASDAFRGELRGIIQDAMAPLTTGQETLKHGLLEARENDQSRLQLQVEKESLIIKVESLEKQLQERLSEVEDQQIALAESRAR